MTLRRGDPDFWPTPEWVTLAFRRHPRSYFAPERGHPIWECCCGDGAMAKVLLQEPGVDVIATDLNDWGYGESGIDVLKTKQLRSPVIMTNPPFNIADDIVEHLLKLKPIVLSILVRTAWLEGRARYDRIFSRFPPSKIFQYVARPTLIRHGVSAEDGKRMSGTTAYMWVQWRANRHGDPTLHWISEGAEVVAARDMPKLGL